MRFSLPVTPSSLLRLEELRAAARPTGSKPPVFNIPEADAAAEAIRALARGEQPSATPPVGRWLFVAIGPIVAAWDPLRPDGPGLVHSCEVDVVAYVAPVPPRYVTAADDAGAGPPVLAAERGELLARASGEVGAAVRERGR